MSVDTNTVKRVARLARIKVTEEEATRMTGELNGILGFVEQLDEVDIEGVEPLTSVVEQAMKKRVDGVTDGNKANDITANAPASEDNFFMVPKVVE
ncbi:Asp-tRNA(Asn)/Glu-tRNA(Gln) amidotransferase subunit GatC [Roseibium sediminis]|uniref:Asp-tRNA(Asn)/Glu-tRNA(Gln) amidotransferase subunit GatC n=1 Tax=Roseibium sediminis TaxID=1775174 RepID=UPI00123DBDEE|nr:Asp-tRNA(Asn)/Glu-tRNA(Gln) amidotransferase subunit GatC [Roseibium sediminis]